MGNGRKEKTAESSWGNVMNGRQSTAFRKAAGVALVAVGLLVFCVGTPILIEFGLLATWLFIWIFLAIFGVTDLSILGLKGKAIAKSLLVAYAFVLPWSLIFFIPVPADIRILLAGITAMLSTLIYRLFSKQKRAKLTKDSANPRSTTQ